MSTICVVGTGYVGLVTGTCLAQLGNQVTCVDVVASKIARLQAGELPIYEPGLAPLVARNTQAGRLRFTTDYATALSGATFIFIAVNTPTVDGGQGADMQYVERAARAIAQHLDHSAILINKSTMPVGSGDLVSAIVHEHLTDPRVQVSVVANPEFLREGSAVADFLQPDRVVLGSADPAATQAVATLYLPLRAPMVLTDLYTAEMIKYASNAFLATKISFINEMARICERLGADVKEVAAGMGYDRRIGRAFLDAGLGYGGSCFPKDVRALAHMAGEAGLHPQLLEAVMAINTDQRQLVVAKLREELGDDLSGRRIGVLGLAFKDNTDDMRDAPALDIIGWLLEAGAEVRAYDPVAEATARQALGPERPVTYCPEAYEAAEGAEAVVVVTEWAAFRELDLQRLRGVMRPPAVMVDGRNLYDPVAEATARQALGPERAVTYCPEAYEAAEGAEAVVVVTEWAAFRELDLGRLRGVMRPPAVMVDGRNLYDPAEMRRLGFRYQGIGRPATRGPNGVTGQHLTASQADGATGHAADGQSGDGQYGLSVQSGHATAGGAVAEITEAGDSDRARRMNRS